MARKNHAAWQIGLAIGGVALIAFVTVVGLVVVFAFSGPSSTKTGQSVQAGKLTRDEFRKKYTDASKETILKDLGRPKSTSDYSDNTSSWHYGGMTRDPISGKDDSATTIWIGTDGKVSYIDFN